MEFRVRRVVTGHDQNGKAIVVSDSMVPVHGNPLRPGQRSHEVWKTNAAPIPIGRDEADPVTGKRQLHPAPQGTMFRISEVPPESDAIRNMTPEQALAARPRETDRTQPRRLGSGPARERRGRPG